MAALWTLITTSPPSAPVSLCLHCSLAAALESSTSLWICYDSSSTWLVASVPKQNLIEDKSWCTNIELHLHVSLKQVEQFVSEPFLKSMDDFLAEVLEVWLQILLQYSSTLFILWDIQFVWILLTVESWSSSLLQNLQWSSLCGHF